MEEKTSLVPDSDTKDGHDDMGAPSALTIAHLPRLAAQLVLFKGTFLAKPPSSNGSVQPRGNLRMTMYEPGLLHNTITKESWYAGGGGSTNK